MLSTETLRRLACDAAVVVVATDAEGNALDVGRRTRVWPSAIRRALQRRDRHCRFPGCTHERWLDAHHLEPWMEGGATSLDLGLMLCRRCHIAVHEGGWRVARIGDDLVFTDPKGRGDDFYGHGTHIAGIVAARSFNNEVDGADAGMAPAAHLINLKVLGSDGTGEAADVIRAIDWAVE